MPQMEILHMTSCDVLNNIIKLKYYMKLSLGSEYKLYMEINEFNV